MGKENLGLVHVYTGNGKGKTSACMGLAVRAVGQGLKVSVIQFMKGGAYTGEMIAAKNFLPNMDFQQFGRHCVKEIKQMKLLGFDRGLRFFDKIREDIECGTCRFCFVNDTQQGKFVEDAFKQSMEHIMSGEYDLVILDEINVAMDLKFLDIDTVIEVLKNKPENCEVILSGRAVPDKIRQVADYVTEMNEIKHPFNTKGTAARRGIEY